MERVLVCGAGGLLGHAVQAAAEWRRHIAVTPLDRAALDITRPADVAAVLDDGRYDIVLNCAGYTDVDGAETDVAGALAGNVVGPAVLAREAARRGAVLIHLSTDHVFGGGALVPYREEDPPAPQSIYGRTKAEGERWVRRLQPRHYIVRTAGLFGAGGRNFVDAILARARAGQALRVVDDQVCARTYAADLAQALLELAWRRPEFGTYHVTNRGGGSWYAFAALVLRLAGLEREITPVTSAEWGAPARRPAYSVLALEKWAEAGLTPLRSIRAAVAAYLRMSEAAGEAF